MFKKIQKKNKKRGFTLIELIVVIAILGILAAVLVPTMSGIISDSKAKVDKANANSVYLVAKSSLAIMNTSGEALTITGNEAATTFDNEDTDPIVVKVKANLGTSFASFSFVLNADKTDVVSATVNGQTYNPIA